MLCSVLCCTASHYFTPRCATHRIILCHPPFLFFYLSIFLSFLLASSLKHAHKCTHYFTQHFLLFTYRTSHPSPTALTPFPPLLSLLCSSSPPPYPILSPFSRRSTPLWCLDMTDTISKPTLLAFLEMCTGYCVGYSLPWP